MYKIPQAAVMLTDSNSWVKKTPGGTAPEKWQHGGEWWPQCEKGVCLLAVSGFLRSEGARVRVLVVDDVPQKKC